MLNNRQKLICHKTQITNQHIQYFQNMLPEILFLTSFSEINQFNLNFFLYNYCFWYDEVICSKGMVKKSICLVFEICFDNKFPVQGVILKKISTIIRNSKVSIKSHLILSNKVVSLNSLISPFNCNLLLFLFLWLFYVCSSISILYSNFHVLIRIFYIFLKHLSHL